MDAPAQATEQCQCRCCIAGGGPAGMMLGLLLARAGVEVIVLEKHADFLRDFRGDTIHPSTLEVMHELGLLEDFLRRPHQELTHLDAHIGDAHLTVVDFSSLPTRCQFIAFMPQWEFLDFLAEHARRYPGFHLHMEAEVAELLYERERVIGVRANTARGPVEVYTELVVGADGRGSIVRERAGLEVLELGAPMDVLWMRIAKGAGDPAHPFGRIAAGKLFIMIDRGDYWQCGYVIAKGGVDEIHARGLPSFREDIAQLAPFLRGRLSELREWSDIPLLTVRVDRLRRWHLPGLLCIGDAAHAMSPIGGVGINLAIQDAIAAANLLARPLQGAVAEGQLHAVQRRRELPTRLTQRLQVFLQNRLIHRVLSTPRGQRMALPLPFRLLRRWPWLCRIPAWVIGIGFRPEHVKDAAA